MLEAIELKKTHWRTRKDESIFGERALLKSGDPPALSDRAVLEEASLRAISFGFYSEKWSSTHLCGIQYSMDRIMIKSVRQFPTKSGEKASDETEKNSSSFLNEKNVNANFL